MGPVELAEKPIVWNLYTKNCSGIRLQLVGVCTKPIKKEAILVALVIVEPQVPLIRIMRQTLRHSGCAHGRQIGIVLKRRRYRIESWIFDLKLRHGENVCSGTDRWGCLLEERRRQIIWKVLLDKLRELWRLDSRDYRGCIGRSQQEKTAKREQFISDNRATQGSAEFVTAKGRYGAASRIPWRTVLKLGARRQLIIRVVLRQRPVYLVGSGFRENLHIRPTVSALGSFKGRS